ncbi:MAG: metal ABC transporter substrate-binding protein [Candidatus Sericytochromatia bacterium]|nr:metal ABC transporter substrate-binding protein [Candidatus Sericytochromatia bacterium]
MTWKRLSLAVLAALAACLPAQAALARVRVVATLPDLACVAREVGGDTVEVTALAYPTQDPHFVDARPHLVLALNRADMLVLAGLELETGWLPTLITGSRNARIQPGGPGGLTGYFDASTVVPLKQVPQQRIDRSMGDIHPGGNPHYMTDPRNGGLVAVALAERLAALDPTHREAYRQRAATLKRTLDALAKAEVRRFAALPARRRQVVVYHQSLVYMLELLGLQQVNTLEPKPGIPPAPGHVATVLGQMRALGVEAIVQEEYWPTSIGRLLASKTGARLVTLPGGPAFEQGETYAHYVSELAGRVYKGLQP